MKPVRLLCYMFLWTWRCTTFSSIPIICILLRNKNVPLIYCEPSGRFQHKLQHRLSAVFHNQSPSLTMIPCKVCTFNFLNFMKNGLEVTYQAWDALFHHQKKHREDSWKYDAQPNIFNKLRGVPSGDETLCRMLRLILLLKQNNFRRRK